MVRSLPVRDYLRTHPWITFAAADLDALGPRIMMLLGEARSMCEHLAGVPLQPAVANRFYEVTLVRGVQATTAIEGNTLTEDQVAGIIRGTFRAPPSRAYQEREAKNVLETLTDIEQQIMNGEQPAITHDLISEINRKILDGTDYDSRVVPGQVRDYPVAVADYHGAPEQDCDYLLHRLADWLESDSFRSDDPEIRFALAFLCAVYAHLYLAWLHPFGDGNGRTARILEFLILARCGMVPFPAAHLLSNHDNLTRDRYYRELSKAGRTGQTDGFISYAAQGFVDGLRDQIKQIREQQFTVTWVAYVHKVTGEFPPSTALSRRRELVLAMHSGVDISKNELPFLHAGLAARYAGTGPRTLSRDLNWLRDVGLVVKRGTRWRSNDSVINAFLSPMAEDYPSE